MNVCQKCNGSIDIYLSLAKRRSHCERRSNLRPFKLEAVGALRARVRGAGYAAPAIETSSHDLELSRESIGCG